MQTIVPFDWSRSVASEEAGATASATNHRTDLPVSKAYMEHVHQLFNYGMNACDDRMFVKNCIVQCFLLVGTRPEPAKDESFATDIFKVFRRLLIEQTGTNLFSSETEGTRELTSLQREALFLKFQRKLTYREVAGIIDLPIEQLRGHISKAMDILLREKWQGIRGFSTNNLSKIYPSN